MLDLIPPTWIMKRRSPRHQFMFCLGCTSVQELSKTFEPLLFNGPSKLSFWTSSHKNFSNTSSHMPLLFLLLHGYMPPSLPLLLLKFVHTSIKDSVISIAENICGTTSYPLLLIPIFHLHDFNTYPAFTPCTVKWYML